eukprot:GFYU01014256.1.p1 GENE.GFYU01014256.1~~GFYU01014256.1.p1  ORF type:complete len:321 (+),score=48.65 GFYU01014256.1:45-1007(+)
MVISLSRVSPIRCVQVGCRFAALHHKAIRPTTSRHGFDLRATMSTHAYHTTRDSGKATVNGVTLHYEKSAPTQDTKNRSVTILCCPGALGTARNDFTPQLEELSSKYGYTVVAYDPRGYGESRPPSRQFELDYYHVDAEDAHGLMESMGYSKYVLLGWSDGANASVLHAAKYPAHVTTLVMWGGNSFVTQEDVDACAATRDINNWSERMRNGLVSVYGEDSQRMWTDWNDCFERFLSERSGDVCMKECADVKCPTLLLHGAKDPLCPAIQPKYFREHIHNLEYYEFPEGKHNPHLRYAEEFNARVDRHIQHVISHTQSRI